MPRTPEVANDETASTSSGVCGEASRAQVRPPSAVAPTTGRQACSATPGRKLHPTPPSTNPAVGEMKLTAHGSNDGLMRAAGVEAARPRTIPITTNSAPSARIADRLTAQRYCDSGLSQARAPSRLEWRTRTPFDPKEPS